MVYDLGVGEGGEVCGGACRGFLLLVLILGDLLLWVRWVGCTYRLLSG